MPRIDPFQLLKCLSVLLGPTGGIKSKEEVHRLANLMTKFSKKLVSKCIYIQILKTTNTELLSQFMDAGGWRLVHMWLTDGIVAKNWALIQELLELLHLCPVKIDRLKSNNCPKLIKGLSKEVCHQGVRLLATRLVEQWLKIVKGEAAPNSVPAQIIGNIGSQVMVENSTNETEHYEVSSETSNDRVGNDSTTVQVEDLEQTTANYRIETNQSQQPLQLHILNNPAVQQQQVQHITKQSFVVVGNGTSVIPSGPVCKITIRDGNQVLVKVETDASNINNALNSNHEMNGEIADSEITDNRDNEGEYDDMTIERLDDDYEGAVNQASSDVKQQTVVTTKNVGNHEVTSKDAAGVKETKDNNAIGDGNKSSDKENRDSHKTDDKKTSGSSSSNTSDKKSHHGSTKGSSSSSSSKHSSSSHRTSSHRSSHRSGSGSSSRSSSSKDKSSRDKDRHHSSSSSKHGSSSSSSKNKSERDKEREKEREKLKKDQADKDKATLEKVQAQAISSKLGKIPKKKTDDEKTSSGDSLLRKSSTDSRESSKENKDKSDPKKSAVAGAASVLEKKNISISIENRKNSQDSARPKTVKTFNSKFRSTGLEEEVKPPPPRSAAKKTAGNILDKKILPAKPLSTLKRTSPLRETTGPSDKRAKLSLDPPLSSPTEEKKGAIKLISPKPKPMVLQESDMFMDALMTASTKSKEPRKRKRRTSVSKDGSSDSKKSESANADAGHDSPSQHPSSPLNAEDRSPLALKPNFKFYQDTLETDEDKEEKQEQLRKEKEDESDETKLDADGNEDYETSISNLVKTEMAALADKAKEAEEDSEETKAPDSPERDGTNADGGEFVKKERSVSPIPEIRYIDGLRSVLLLQKRKGPKKNLKWKTELESVRYFELDETERVNVTKTFTDMKQMEKLNEREAFQMARKLSNEDLMEEKTRWKPLIPIDLMPALVEPGKDSREKEIQYAREKGILQALYFNRSMIPDSASEPDEERHHVMTDPKVIPLEDLTGNKESEKDFTSVPWPEPKLQVPPPVPSMPPPGYHFPAGFPHSQPPMLPTMGLPGSMGSMPPMQQGPMMGTGSMNHMGGDMGVPMGATPVGGAGWRTGDGKVVVPDVGMNPMQPPMPNMPAGFPPGMDGPMGPPGMMRPPMFNQQEGFGMIGPDDMGYANFQGPPGPGMYGPGQNFPGGPPRGGGPMHGGNRGRGAGPGWFRGGGVTGGPMLPRMGTGGGSGGGGWRAGWRGNGKQPPICRQFTKNGFCRVGDKCQYLHPGVNCPPF